MNKRIQAASMTLSWAWFHQRRAVYWLFKAAASLCRRNRA